MPGTRDVRWVILALLGALILGLGILGGVLIAASPSDDRINTWATVVAAFAAIFSTIISAVLMLRQLRYQVAIESGRVQVEYFNRLLYVCYDVVRAADRFVSAWPHVKPLSLDDSVEESSTRKDQRQFQLNEFVETYIRQEREVQVLLHFLDEFQRRAAPPASAKLGRLRLLAKNLIEASEKLYSLLVDKRDIDLAIAATEFSRHPRVVAARQAADELASALVGAVSEAYNPERF